MLPVMQVQAAAATVPLKRPSKAPALRQRFLRSCEQPSRVVARLRVHTVSLLSEPRQLPVPLPPRLAPAAAGRGSFSISTASCIGAGSGSGTATPHTPYSQSLQGTPQRPAVAGIEAASGA